ncbi:uncharacterized protein LOC133843666 [Drosophila sulfurigaster albostrigata]|uniref:uncharacterized protein LOC133843666 n=1 Tax=Drosophila sulfurigaster albostrigata TaxID=89887 RepID=UPI002D21DC1F|nr:uncharacterized protein LOC133843666 [Drosophila sulfurigaster albostrigata]
MGCLKASGIAITIISVLFTHFLFIEFCIQRTNLWNLTNNLSITSIILLGNSSSLFLNMFVLARIIKNDPLGVKLWIAYSIALASLLILAIYYRIFSGITNDISFFFIIYLFISTIIMGFLQRNLQRKQNVTFETQINDS